MKKLWQKAVAFFLCITVSVSAFVVPASAVGAEAVLGALTLITSAANAVKTLFDASASGVRFAAVLEDFMSSDGDSEACPFVLPIANVCVQGYSIETSRQVLDCLAQDWNANYRASSGCSLYVSRDTMNDGTNINYLCVVYSGDGAGRGRSPIKWALCDGNRRILYSRVNPQTVTDGHWTSVRNFKSPYHMMSSADLYNLATEKGGVVRQSVDLYLVFNKAGTNIFVDPNGFPYVAPVEGRYALDSSRKDTNVKETDGEGNVTEIDNSVTDNSTNIDLSGMSVTFPDGTFQYIDQLIYDDSTKTYYVDSHDQYETNYHYTYQYHINYTSITYIGQTEEYNKYYEVYYELPDGRSSADLSREELEQLNISMDVIPYDRAADDARLRSLYHFDGDTRDSSYWNYCTSFDWDYGGSITYMDASTFGGALYLDEQPHGFTLTLPSELGTDDFTIQFRYYQSHTQAPAMDSYISSGSTTLLGMTGKYFFPGSDTSVTPVWFTNVGTWNEIALIRSHGTLYYYVNGVRSASKALTAALTDKLEFIFGTTQQTYKYLDELRVLSYALVPDGSNYTPTSVPYDTNLALVLPEGYIAVADEYWSVNLSDDATSAANFTAGDQLPAGFETSGLAISSGTNGMTFTPTSSGSWLRVPTGTNDRYFGFSLNFTLSSGDILKYTGVSRRGEFSKSLNSPSSSMSSLTIPELFFTGGSIKGSSNYIYVYLDQPVEIAALEWFVTSACSSQSAAVTALNAYSDAFSAGHESNVVLIEEGLDADLLAVKTDIPITGHQIGGVRPSLPVKGQVWALVESGYIRSLQIYTGSAWEAVDGRIWTGSRWIPYSSFNVITLKDMSDIVDGSGNYEYIYTEEGFWGWLQRWLNEFKQDLFAILRGGKDTCSHAYVDEVITEATCTEPGQRRRTCSLCGESVLEDVPALGHDWLPVEVIQDHYDLPAGTVCPGCGSDAFSFVLDDDGVFHCSCPGCDTSWDVQGDLIYGETTYQCSRCDETYVESNEGSSGLFESLGNFLSDGVRWVGSKLSQLVESLSGLNDAFRGFAERIRSMGGEFPALIGAFFAIMPEDLMTVIWFGLIAVVTLLAWRKWFS